MRSGKAYHRFFEGYSERKVWDEEHHRYIIESYYSGDYHQAQIPAEEKKRHKREYLIGYVCAVLLFIIVCTRPTVSSASLIPVFPTLTVCLGMLWQLPSLVSYLNMPDLLILRQYRERRNFMYLSMGLAFFCALCVGTRLFCMALYQTLSDPLEWVALAGLALDAGIFYRTYRTEKGIFYLRIPNEAKIPEDAYDISFREKK